VEDAAMSIRPGRAAFVFIFITVALDMLALGIIIPVLPNLILAFESGNEADAAHLNSFFNATWATMQFVFSPIMGLLSDRYGRRPIILLSNLGLGLDYVLMAVAPTVGWLWIGRLLSGITSASFSIAAAYIADVTPAERRAAKYGMLGAAFGLGFIIGPALGGMLGHIDLRLPFWVAGGLSLANFIYGCFILPESLPPERRSKFSWAKANPIGSVRLLGRHPVLISLSIAGVFAFLAHESLPNIYVYFVQRRFGWGETMVGWSLASVGLCSAVVSAVLVGVLVKRLGDRAVLLAGYFFWAAGFILFGCLAHPLLFMTVAIPIECLGSLATPAQSSIMTRRIDPTEQGHLQGAMQSLRAITGIVGPLLFASVYAAGVHGHVPFGSPWYLAAALVLAAFCVSIYAVMRDKQTTESARSP
jgi:DHA1 family tetracycline resistance protein-like MFS transporter